MEIPIGPNPCSLCSGEYGEHEEDCLNNKKKQSVYVRIDWIENTDKSDVMSSGDRIMVVPWQPAGGRMDTNKFLTLAPENIFQTHEIVQTFRHGGRIIFEMKEK